MYFLEHYAEICDLYMQAIGHPEKDFDKEEAEFYYQMGEAYRSLTEMYADAAPFTREKADEAVQIYYHVLTQFDRIMAEHNPSIAHDQINHMYKEYELLTYVNCDQRKNLPQLLNEAEKETRITQSTIDHPEQKYMAVHHDPNLTSRGWLQDVQRDDQFLNELTDKLQRSKKNVHGSSEKFDQMELAFQNLQNLAMQINWNDSFSAEDMKNYRHALKTLNEKAAAYELYKTHWTEQNPNGRYDRLKEKEKRRVDFARTLQKFAGSRYQRINFTQHRSQLMFKLEQTENVWPKNFDKDPEVHFKRMIRQNRRWNQCYDKNQQFSAKKLLAASVKFKNNPSEKSCLDNVNQVLQGAFGCIYNDDKLNEMISDFLKTGKLDNAFIEKCSNIAKRQRGKDTEQSKQLRNNAMRRIELLLSMRPKLTENMILISGLLEMLERDTSDTAPLSLEEKSAASGIHQISRLVSDGQNACLKIRMNSEKQPADFENILLDFAVMKAVEKNAEAFSKNRSNTINPVYTQFGMDKNCVTMLKENIRNSEEFRNLLKLPYDQVRSIVKNPQDGTEKLFCKISEKAFQKTMQVSTADSHQDRMNNVTSPRLKKGISVEDRTAENRMQRSALRKEQFTDHESQPNIRRSNTVTEHTASREKKQDGPVHQI